MPANRSQSGAQRAAWPRRTKESADVPGHPGSGPQEIEVVQKVYTRFVADKQTEREIAEQLNGAGMPSSSCFSGRFDTLVRAYTLIGWEPDRTSPTSRSIGACGGAHANRISAIFDELLAFGATVSVDPQTDFLKINSEYSASLILARCRQASGGNYRWHLRFDESLDPDIITAARLFGGCSFWSTNQPQLGIVAMHHCRWSELMVAF